jgi:hypothetical protein
VAGRTGSTEKSNDLIGTRIRDPLACSVVAQPTMLLRCSHLILNTLQYQTVTKFMSFIQKVIWELPFSAALFHLVSVIRYSLTYVEQTDVFKESDYPYGNDLLSNSVDDIEVSGDCIYSTKPLKTCDCTCVID